MPAPPAPRIDPTKGRNTTDVPVGRGVHDFDVVALQAECDHMWDVLLARKTPPELPHSPFLNLQEIAVAYLGRALELDGLIQRAVDNKDIPKNHPANQFRLHQLANLIVLARKAADLGSRRLTEFALLHDAQKGRSI